MGECLGECLGEWEKGVKGEIEVDSGQNVYPQRSSDNWPDDTSFTASMPFRVAETPQHRLQTASEVVQYV
eukprot:7476128-Pyramimonas_sp.AAC.1